MSRLSSLFPLCLLSVAVSTVHAESTPAEDSEKTMEEVIVTATHTGETDLQETPIAITVHSEEDMGQHGVENVRDLVRVTPGLSVSQNSSYAHIYIRGVGSNNSFLGSDPSSTMYVDGVYIARPLSLFSDFLGVDRVEVLRGPQGVLYGRNSTGGAINVISATPEHDNFYKIKVGLGSFDERKLNLFGNLDINSGISANLAINREARDGYVENKGIGDDLSDKGTRGARGAIKINDSNGVEVILRGDYTKADEEGHGYKSEYQKIDQSFAAETIIEGDAGTQTISDFHTVSINTPSYHMSTQKGVSMELNVDLGNNLTMTYIPARRSSYVEFLIDSDWTEATSRESYFDETQQQVSNELRFLKEGENYTLVFGGYLFREEAESNAAITLTDLNGVLPTGIAAFDAKSQTESRAVFANAQYSFTNALSLTLGSRISQEEKHFSSKTSDETKSWTDMTPRIGVEYIVNDDLFIYSTVSEGFKSGGFNFTTKDSFEPEYVTSYEIGAKSTWLDGTLGLNTSLFYYDYEDLQVQAFEEANGTPAIVIGNAAEADILGLEVEFSAVPNNMLDITGSFTYLDAEYDSFITARSKSNGFGIPPTLTPVDAEGNKLNHTPEFKINLDIDFHHPLADGEMTYLLSTYWQDTEYFTAFNDNITSQESYTLVDFRVSYRFIDDSVEVAAFGRNLTDEEYSNSQQDFSPTGVALNIMPPRTFGVEFSYQSL